MIGRMTTEMGDRRENENEKERRCNDGRDEGVVRRWDKKMNNTEIIWKTKK